MLNDRKVLEKYRQILRQIIKIAYQSGYRRWFFLFISLCQSALSVYALMKDVLSHEFGESRSLIALALTPAIALVAAEFLSFSFLSKSKGDAPKYKNLSIVGLMIMQRAQSTRIGLAVLVLASGVYVTTAKFLTDNLSWTIIFILASIATIVFIRDQLFRYRVRRGFYGHDEEDVREIIAFSIRELSDIDGDGTVGKKRPIISKSDLKEIVEAQPDAPGAPA